MIRVKWWYSELLKILSHLYFFLIPKEALQGPHYMFMLRVHFASGCIARPQKILNTNSSWGFPLQPIDVAYSGPPVRAHWWYKKWLSSQITIEWTQSNLVYGTAVFIHCLHMKRKQLETSSTVPGKKSIMVKMYALSLCFTLAAGFSAFYCC